MSPRYVEQNVPLVLFCQVKEDPGPTSLSQVVDCSPVVMEMVDQYISQNIAYLARSLPAVTSWEKEAFLILLVSRGSRTESITKTTWN